MACNVSNLFVKLCLDMPSTTVIYARVSSNIQATIADQVKAAKDYVKRLKLPVITKIFTDVGSGTNLGKLSSHSEMCNFMIDNPGSHLVIFDVSRLGRSLEVFSVLEYMIENNTTIHSIHDNLKIRKKSADSIIKAHKLICSSIEFSQSLSKRIKTSIALKKSRGVFTGRKVPYGFMIKLVTVYNVQERFLVKDPQTFNDAQRLSKTVRKNVNRPDGMTLKDLKQHRLKFRSYVKMANKTPV